MIGARWKPFFTATLFAVAIFAAGCAADDKPPPPAPDSGPQPKLLSDLSTVSDAPINPLPAAHATPARGEGMLHDSSPDAVAAGPRTFQMEPGISRVVGNES